MGYNTTTTLSIRTPDALEEMNFPGDMSQMAADIEAAFLDLYIHSATISMTEAGSPTASITDGVLNITLPNSGLLHDAAKLDLTGGTMGGNIVMANNRITGLPLPSAGTEPATKTYVDAALPIGSIIMYGGTSAPAGWKICDGTAHGVTALTALLGGPNVPDLRNKFVVGVGSSYARHATGGEATHVLSIAELPSHDHGTWTGTMNQNWSHSHGGATNAADRSLSHSHGGGTGWMAQNNIHSHGYNRGEVYGGGFANGSTLVGQVQYSWNEYSTGAVDINHWHGISPDGVDHLHGINASDINHQHQITPNGGNAAHENRPPYYALVYIIKVA